MRSRAGVPTLKRRLGALRRVVNDAQWIALQGTSPKAPSGGFSRRVPDALDGATVSEGGAQRIEQVCHGHPLSAYRVPSVAAIGERVLQAPGEIRPRPPVRAGLPLRYGAGR